MDHTQAIELKAVERYLLNELDVHQRDEFEEHAFVCQSCARELRVGFEFRENAIALFAQAKRVPVQVEEQASAFVSAGKPSWADRIKPWLQLPSLAPTFAAVALLGVVGWQREQLNQPAVFSEAAVATVAVPAVVRGTETLPVIPARSVSKLDVEFVVSKDFTWRLVDESGKTLNPGAAGRTNDQSHYAAFVGPFRQGGRYALLLKDSASGVESEYRFVVSE